mgnify:CR=1 FL=1
MKIEALDGKIYMTCAACMSVRADALSWANMYKNRIVKNPTEADNIIVLSCQVTDLAVLNDFRVIEDLYQKFPDKKYFISGCLAKRLDIEIPKFAQRLEIPVANYQEIKDLSLVKFEKPFWVQDFKESDSELELKSKLKSEKKNGHLFREMYPLRIGKSCPFNCSYCTIKMTRGKFEQYLANKLEKEFVKYDNVLLVADSPMPDQIKQWCSIAIKNNKEISIRNVEPSVVVKCVNELLELADIGLLKIFHSPIQSNNIDVLKDMNRPVDDTLKTIEFMKKLKSRNVFIATNIIIDYKDFPEDFSKIYDLYDYVSWNPLWDGKWDRLKAEKRFEKYILNNYVVRGAK